METDPEVKGERGNHYTTYFRQYDPRVGRWWSNDPVVHPWESPYVAMYNNPSYFSDPFGNDPPDGENRYYKTVEGKERLERTDANGDRQYYRRPENDEERERYGEWVLFNTILAEANAVVKEEARPQKGWVGRVLDGAGRALLDIGDEIQDAIVSNYENSQRGQYWEQKWDNTKRLGKGIGVGTLAYIGDLTSSYPFGYSDDPILMRAQLDRDIFIRNAATAIENMDAEDVGYVGVYVVFIVADVAIGSKGHGALEAADKIEDVADHGGYLFRGTSRGYEGNPAHQRIGVTPASEDPLVATAFGTESERYGEGVVQIASRNKLENEGVQISQGNILHKLEAEVGVETLPIEFAKRAEITITASQARIILKDMGFDVPSVLSDKRVLNQFLHESGRLTKAQRSEFVRRASGL